MKRLILLAALIFAGVNLNAATSTLANAQVNIDPATGMLLSIPTTGGGGGATGGVSILASVSIPVTQGGPLTVSGSVSVTNLNGITVNAHSVTQGGPFTVSGSVGVTSGVGGISTTASQGGPWTVSGSVGVTSGVGGISVTASVAAGTATIGNVGVTNTVNVVNLAGTATMGNVGVTNTVNVAQTGSPWGVDARGSSVTASINAGTNYIGAVGVSGSVAVVNAAGTSFIGSVGISTTASVQGDIASGVADSGNPVKTGGRAKTQLPTAVTDGQRVNTTFDKSGRQLVRQSPRERVFSATLGITYVAEVTVLAAGGASVFRDLTSIMISNSGTNNNTVTIRDSLAGTTRFVFEIASQGGGVVTNFTVPLPQGTANNVWSAQLTNSPTGGAVRVNLVAQEDN